MTLLSSLTQILGTKSLSEVTVKFAENEQENEQSDLTKRNRVCCTSLTKGLSNVKPIGKSNIIHKIILGKNSIFFF